MVQLTQQLTNYGPYTTLDTLQDIVTVENSQTDLHHQESFIC